MSKIPFSEDELTIAKYDPGLIGGQIPVLNYPIPPSEAVRRLFWDKDPVWVPGRGENLMFCPSVIPDNIARGFVYEGQRYDKAKYGGKDMFGVEWVYVDQVGGSMVKPGSPLLDDANEWEEKVVFPDIDSWDWEGSAELNKEFLKSDKFIQITLLNGCWFERLISFMDFEGAAMAMIDEDQEDAVKALMHKCTDLYMRIVDKCVEYYPQVDGFCIHDDWGSQMAPFFSARCAREIILPEMKRFVAHVHSKNLPCELHSCGHIEDRIDIFIEAGFDGWRPMEMNDTPALYEKYGDRFVVGVTYDKDLPENPTDDDYRAAAKDFADRFCKPGTVVSFAGLKGRIGAPSVFYEELYIQSRLHYLGEA